MAIPTHDKSSSQTFPGSIEEQYLSTVKHLLEDGNFYNDRTGTGARSMFVAMLRHNLKDGFPLLTTKHVSLKGILYELLWFLSGSTNVKDLQKYGVKIWDDWADEDGSLGEIYGYQWRKIENTRKVPVRIKDKGVPKVETGLDTSFTLDFSSNKYGLIGKTFDGDYGTYVVVKEYRELKEGLKNKRWFYDVKFTGSGYLCTAADRKAILDKTLRDPYFPGYLGVACRGQTQNVSEEDRSLLLETWLGMIRRCYDPNHIGYDNYGGKGVFVSNRWLLFENFVTDVKTLRGWQLKKHFQDEYSLDKDYYSSNCYDINTCIWASKQEQSANQDGRVSFIATSPEGKKSISNNVTHFSKLNNLCDVSVSAVLKNEYPAHKGWTFEEAPLVDGTNYRSTVHDQIKNLIANIKDDPHSRRHCISAWGVPSLDYMKLYPCHTFAQFNVTGNKLNLYFMMRSSDVFLGLPYNIASYALLCHMVAQVCGYEPGELVYCGTDVHLYENHRDQATEQLKRDPRPLPTLKMNDNIKSMDSFSYDDFELIGYAPHPSIKAPVAV